MENINACLIVVGWGRKVKKQMERRKKEQRNNEQRNKKEQRKYLIKAI